MSYYFAIVGAQDNPLFEYEFGTSKQGGDGQSRFNEQLRHLNQFILHSSLDIAEEVQWAQGQMCVSPKWSFKKKKKNPLFLTLETELTTPRTGISNALTNSSTTTYHASSRAPT